MDLNQNNGSQNGSNIELNAAIRLVARLIVLHD